MQFVDYHLHQKVVDFMYRVYGWMSVGLAITAVTAYAISTSDQLALRIASNPVLSIGLFLFQIGLVIALSAFSQKMSFSTALLLFLVYAGTLGVTLSSIFLVYSLPSIYSTFFITAGMFCSMALYGYLTQTDLTQIGNVASMSVFGIVFALIINMFWQNSTFDLVVSVIGVVAFTILAASDTQKIKEFGAQSINSGNEVGNISIIGALILYLDFINLFLFLLRILGQRERR